MADPASEPYAFEKFPRGPLRFVVSRRQFLPAMLNEFIVWNDQLDGAKVYRLADLGTFSDEELGGVIPVITAGSRITVKDGLVWGQPPKAPRPRQLFPVNSPAATAFNHFNGLTYLEDAARALAPATGWETERSFAYTRGLFLCLVIVGLSHPRD